ncbi:hypothetical protein GOP47_0030658 [Adiantum capillus-veneris]|nr:hypothetical protein GOP47_0030658 [Adiantum capillus-veneris]
MEINEVKGIQGNGQSLAPVAKDESRKWVEQGWIGQRENMHAYVMVANRVEISMASRFAREGWLTWHQTFLFGVSAGDGILPPN